MQFKIPNNYIRLGQNPIHLPSNSIYRIEEVAFFSCATASMRPCDWFTWRIRNRFTFNMWICLQPFFCLVISKTNRIMLMRSFYSNVAGWWVQARGNNKPLHRSQSDARTPAQKTFQENTRRYEYIHTTRPHLASLKSGSYCPWTSHTNTNETTTKNRISNFTSRLSAVLFVSHQFLTFRRHFVLKVLLVLVRLYARSEIVCRTVDVNFCALTQHEQFYCWRHQVETHSRS